MSPSSVCLVLSVHRIIKLKFWFRFHWIYWSVDWLYGQWYDSKLYIWYYRNPEESLFQMESQIIIKTVHCRQGQEGFRRSPYSVFSILVCVRTVMRAAVNKSSDVVFIQIQFKGKKAFVSASIMLACPWAKQWISWGSVLQAKWEHSSVTKCSLTHRLDSWCSSSYRTWTRHAASRRPPPPVCIRGIT